MTELLTYRSQRQRLDDTAGLGLLIFLAGWSMFLAGLLFAYGALRLQAPQWPPAGVAPIPAGLPAAGVAALVAASAAMQVGLARIERGRPLELSAALILALLFDLMFLGLQAILWHRFELSGAPLARNAYGSVLSLLTALAALHGAVAAVACAVMLSRSFDGRYSAPRHLPIRLWTTHAHFVTAAWLVIFVLAFAV